MTHPNLLKKQKPTVRSFLKWAGSKYRLLDNLLPLLPEGKRFIEPFAGSAVVFANVDHEQSIIAETNDDLVNLYRLLQSDSDRFISESRRMFSIENNNKENYYQFREKFNQTTDPFDRAVLFLYLNRYGYNGLCRYNKKGGFNVPFGSYVKPYYPETELQYFAKKIQTTEIIHADFREVLAKAKKGDVVYCDPPYVPLSKTARFTQYHLNSFSESDQIDLADCALKLKKKGAKVIISNHDTEFTRKLYSKANTYYIDVQRAISCNVAKRATVKEVIAIY